MSWDAVLKAAEEELKAVKEQDLLSIAEGYTHRVTFIKHGVGDDRTIDVYTKHDPTTLLDALQKLTPRNVKAWKKRAESTFVKEMCTIALEAGSKITVTPLEGSSA